MDSKKFTITTLGDKAVILNFGNRIDELVNRKVLYLFHRLKSLALPYVTDIVPAYSSLAIFYDAVRIKSKTSINKSGLEIFTDQMEKLIKEEIKTTSFPSRKIKVPVCYSEKYAYDIKSIAQEKKIAVSKIIDIHNGKKYRVYMIGFLPGFAYMGEVDEKIAIPRKTQPRLKVDAGSVGIAGMQTGIYPFDSPGGWQIIGKTPLKLFNTEKDDPVLLRPGDEIEFYSITENEFTNY